MVGRNGPNGGNGIPGPESVEVARQAELYDASRCAYRWVGQDSVRTGARSEVASTRRGTASCGDEAASSTARAMERIRRYADDREGQTLTRARRVVGCRRGYFVALCLRLRYEHNLKGAGKVDQLLGRSVVEEDQRRTSMHGGERAV